MAMISIMPWVGRFVGHDNFNLPKVGFCYHALAGLRNVDRMARMGGYDILIL